MTRLASRFGAANLIRRDRPLTREELFRVVPSVFSEDKHAELIWRNIATLPENTIPYVRQAIEAIQVGQRYSEFGWSSIG